MSAIRLLLVDDHAILTAAVGCLVEAHLERAASGRARRSGWRLTPKEREVVQLIVEGKTIKETARALDVSPRTVETHRQHVMRKLGVSSVAALTKWAVRHRLTGEDP
jgi:DNA-binding CsgD family transcriptional regulator